MPCPFFNLWERSHNKGKSKATNRDCSRLSIFVSTPLSSLSPAPGLQVASLSFTSNILAPDPDECVKTLSWKWMLYLNALWVRSTNLSSALLMYKIKWCLIALNFQAVSSIPIENRKTIWKIMIIHWAITVCWIMFFRLLFVYLYLHVCSYSYHISLYKTISPQ